MGGSRDEPIRSAFAHDPELDEPIEAFIIALGERIDMVQEAERAGDLTAGVQRLEQLAEESERLGFGPLAEAARHAAQAAAKGKTEAAHERIVELTRMVQRVRLGHRGAL